MEENFNTVENMDIDIEKEGSTFTIPFLNKSIKIPFTKKTLIIVGSGLLFIIILIIIIASLAHGKKNNKKEEKKNNNYQCIIDNEDNCLTCIKNKCGSCNFKYILTNDGECVPDFSLRANYISYNDNEYVELLNYTFSDYITELIIDKEKISPSSNYMFPKSGEHTIYMTINTEKLSSLDKMFYQMRKLKSIYFSKKFNTKNITSMERMFVSCSQLTSVNISNFNTGIVKSFNYLFYYASNLETVILPKSKASKLETVSFMFDGCFLLRSIDFSNFIVNSPYLTSLHGTFSGCHLLENINMSNFNTEGVTDMGELFEDCYSLTSIDLTKFKTTKLQYMNKMFYRCKKMEKIDLSHFNTENVVKMEYLFYGCSMLGSVELSSFNTKNLQTMDSMFNGCYSLSSIDLSGFNTEKVTNMMEIFAFCSNLLYLDISHFSDNANKYYDFFTTLPNDGTIKLNHKIYEKIKGNIPSSWKIIYID